MNSGRECFCLFLEPARDGRDRRRVLENMAEERPGDTYFANQAHISTVQRRHERDTREPADPRSHYSVGEPPVRVNDLRLEAASRANGVDEIGAEKSDEREPGGPGRGDVARHVSRVGQLLVAARCVSESLDADPIDLFFGGKTGARRSNDANVHVLSAAVSYTHLRAHETRHDLV